jgi:hypothetical protein
MLQCLIQYRTEPGWLEYLGQLTLGQNETVFAEYCTISTKCSVMRDTQDFLMCAKIALIQKKIFRPSRMRNYMILMHLVEIVQ